MAQKILRNSGNSEDGKTVVHGVYKLRASNGLALSDVLEFFKSNNLLVDWEDYICEALDEKINPWTLFASIQDAVLDAHDKVYWNEFEPRLQLAFIEEIKKRDNAILS